MTLHYLPLTRHLSRCSLLNSFTAGSSKRSSSMLYRHKAESPQQQQQPPVRQNIPKACIQQQWRAMSSWRQRGYDLTLDSLNFGPRPKVILDAYAPTGFNVINMLKKTGETEYYSEGGQLHMYGSILAFPFGCFLWKVKDATELTFESLAPVLLHSPKIESLFIGCNGHVPAAELNRIQLGFLRERNIIVEKMDVANAMGTFNILNAEDRHVACALIVDPSE